MQQTNNQDVQLSLLRKYTYLVPTNISYKYIILCSASVNRSEEL